MSDTVCTCSSYTTSGTVDRGLATALGGGVSAMLSHSSISRLFCSVMLATVGVNPAKTVPTVAGPETPAAAVSAVDTSDNASTEDIVRVEGAIGVPGSTVDAATRSAGVEARNDSGLSTESSVPGETSPDTAQLGNSVGLCRLYFRWSHLSGCLQHQTLAVIRSQSSVFRTRAAVIRLYSSICRLCETVVTMFRLHLWNVRTYSGDHNCWSFGHAK